MRFALSLGANVGDALGTLREAVAEIAALPGVVVTGVSSVYRTAPVGGVEQDDFCNLVVVGDTALPPRDLSAAVHRIEDAHGRTREVRWGPRTLDIDVLAVGDLRSDDPELILPHPRAHERAFVLVPWAEVDPAAELPGRGRVADLAGAIDAAGVRRLPGVDVQPKPGERTPADEGDRQP
ncbi:2-amino-4-hydroxy-6-hydroxymethyldihydropteridine diphosphokinase [Nigerium massiliense]|uniref:2-amino-4-hydroxy-6- hydroxymethyldihydropteridine diphosphokinase n=1 Tax=Nigerium massiliense TaxID=1522317 RepID=UPI000693DFF0|nr:2-amino-4-hydroxy-6-hydroxymethyldihydropteridine diphosphokinase [Nigerium massiliense]